MTDLAFVEANTILRGVTGSHAYGTATPDSDHDEMAIFVESKKQVIGLNPCNSYVNRPRAPGEKAQPGDVELTAYSLRHFARLCMNGNPTVMEMLFLPDYTVATPVGKLVRKLRNDFVSYRAGNNYLGYLIAQKQKMKGERSQTTKRPDLVEKYGYDTKFAMHSVRLGLQGLEFLQTRAIQLPTPHAGELRKIRDGGYSEAEILEIIEGLESRLRTWVEVNKDVDHSVDRGKIDQLLVHLHEEHWNAQRT